MNAVTVSIICISMIFIATTLGSSLVFFFKKDFSVKVNNMILGFASGVMIASAFFGLLNPAIEQAGSLFSNKYLMSIPVIVGFLAGGLLLLLLDKIIPHFHALTDTEEGYHSDRVSSRQLKFFLAVTIHNIPEGLSVGFVCGYALSQNTPLAIAAALSLSIGIAIQNIPEGSAVSIPMLSDGIKKPKAFTFGMLSGIVEPIFAVIALFVASSLEESLPWLLSFAAGAMIYVTIDELLPSARKGNLVHYGLWSFMFGFVVMMALEILI